jgi:type IV pilus assembly protein PilB
LILRNASVVELKREAVKLGMSTLRMSALQKVREGLTTIEETVRVTDTDKVWIGFLIGF